MCPYIWAPYWNQSKRENAWFNRTITKLIGLKEVLYNAKDLKVLSTSKDLVFK